MISRLAGVRGVDIAGSGVAYPCDVDAAATPLGNADVWRRLLGSDWRAELERREWEVDFPETAWGVARRHAWPFEVEGSRTHAEALAEHAAREALEDVGLKANEVDAIYLATSTPSRTSSSCSARLGKLLKTDAATLDVRAGGASALAAWSQAALGVVHGARSALVVAVECVPSFLEEGDLTNRLLFSCAAGAIILRAAPDGDGGLVASAAGRVDCEGRAFTVPGSLPPRAGERYTFQEADKVYLESLRATWELAVRELRGMSDAPPDHFLPYAVTRSQLTAAERALSVEASSARASLREHGCTGCASPLLQVHDLREAGLLARGDSVGLATVGGGVSWQSMLWRV